MPNTDDGPKITDSLAFRLLRAQRAFKPPGKTGHNAHQNYDYVAYDRLADAMHTALNSADLVGTFAEVNYEQHHVHVVLTVQAPGLDEAELWPVSWPVMGPRPQDRGAALTFARKQAVFDVFPSAARGEGDPDGAPVTPVQAADDSAGASTHPPMNAGRSLDPMTQPQEGKIKALLRELGLPDRDAKLAYVRDTLGDPDIRGAGELTKGQASRLIRKAEDDIRKQTDDDSTAAEAEGQPALDV